MATKIEIKENAQQILKSIGNKENVISAGSLCDALKISSKG